MYAQITPATVANWALIDLGLPANFSLDVENDLGGTIGLVWPRVVDRTFGLHDWTFCRRTAKLPRKADAPETGWNHAFTLPGDKVGDPLAYFAGPRSTIPVRDFYLEGYEVHADVPELWARCRVLLDPMHWEPTFRACFTTALSSALAIPLLQDAELAAELHVKAFGTPSQGGTGGEFGRLIAQNMASSPVGPRHPGPDPLVDARFM